MKGKDEEEDYEPPAALYSPHNWLGRGNMEVDYNKLKSPAEAVIKDKGMLEQSNGLVLPEISLSPSNEADNVISINALGPKSPEKESASILDKYFVSANQKVL